MFKKKKIVATNEFNQQIEGTSLTKESWKRLKKNKMAIFGLIVVIIYALVCAFANLLPLYPYDEVVMEHQHLQPSLTKTSGELVLAKKYQDVFYSAWREGRLKLTEEEDKKIRTWIQQDKTNKVLQYIYDQGAKQLEEGLFQFSAADQRTIDRTKDKIQNDVMVTIKKIYYPVNGKVENIEKVSADELVNIYAELNNIKSDTVKTSVDNELISALVNEIKANDTELSSTDARAQAEIDFENYSEKTYESKVKQNLIGKIESIANRESLKRVKEEIQADPSLKFPIKESFDLENGMHVELKASKVNDRRYYLGTDYLGRDMLSRIIYGGRVSIAIGLVGTITSVFIGILVGSVAGYSGGKIDYYLMRFVDVMYGLPYMLLVIICMAVFGRSIFNLFFALALISWLTIARMVRGQIMSLKNQEYVEAARSMGASMGRIITRHMIPNSLSIIIVYSTIRIPNFIMQESFLSFLGLGVQAPYASWGSLIGDAVASMTLYPWKLIFPSLAMVIFLFAMNFLGDGLRDAFDPQSKNQL